MNKKIDYQELTKRVNSEVELIRLAHELGHKEAKPRDKFLCLVHKEKTASMKYYQAENILHCFGCGCNLRATDLVKEHFDYKYTSEALHWLRDHGYTSITLPDWKDGNGKGYEPEPGERPEVLDVGLQFELLINDYRIKIIDAKNSDGKRLVREDLLRALQINYSRYYASIDEPLLFSIEDNIVESELGINFGINKARLEAIFKEVDDLKKAAAKKKQKQPREEEIDQAIIEAVAKDTISWQSEEITELRRSIQKIMNLPSNVSGSEEKKQRISESIMEALKTKVDYYQASTERYFLDKTTNILYRIDEKAAPIKAFLYRVFGINYSTVYFLYLIAALKCLPDFQEVTIRSHWYFEPKTYAFYFSNNDNSIYRITEQNIDFVPNGSDGILFEKDYQVKPIDIDLSSIQKDSDLLDQHVFRYANFTKQTGVTLLDRNDQVIVFSTWFYSLFFNEIMTSKPLCVLCGEKGSGKTTILRLLLKLLFGEQADVSTVPNDKKDAETLAGANMLLCFDNIDQIDKRKRSWFLDYLATLSTGASARSRKLYTDREEVVITFKAFIALTTREVGVIRRDDIADRALLFYFDRVVGDDYKSRQALSDSSLIDAVLNQRAELLAELFKRLQFFISKLRKNENIRSASSLRLADFDVFSNKLYKDTEINIKAILDKVSLQQSAFYLENEAILKTLEIWLELSSNETSDQAEFDDVSNAGREIKATELFHELKKIAKDEQITWYIEKEDNFGKRLSNITSDLRKFFRVNVRTDKKVKLYRFWRR